MEVEVANKKVQFIVCRVISTMGKMEQGNQREYWGGSAALLSRVDRLGLSDKMTIEQRPEGGDIEHLLDIGGEGRTFQAERSANAKALRQSPLAFPGIARRPVWLKLNEPGAR